MKIYHLLTSSKNIICLGLLLIAISINASSHEVLKVWKSNGLVEYYYFSQKPKLTFSNHSALLHFDNVAIEYPFSSYLKITFDEDENETSIDNIMQDDFFDENFNNGLNSNTACRIYDINGNLVLSPQLESNHNIKQFNLPKGIYIVKSNKSTFKILVK